jgi:hypothetical protein
LYENDNLLSKLDWYANPLPHKLGVAAAVAENDFLLDDFDCV